MTRAVLISKNGRIIGSSSPRGVKTKGIFDSPRKDERLCIFHIRQSLRTWRGGRHQLHI